MYKIPTGPKPLRIRFDKIGRFIIFLYANIKYLILFHYGLFDKNCDKIEYLISKKNLLQIVLIVRVDSYNSLPIKKVLTFHNVIILIISVVNKNKNKYYYNIFLEKGLYKNK